MRSIGGYGQRSRTARAATGCGVLAPGRPRPAARRHVRAPSRGTPYQTLHTQAKDATIPFSIYYIYRFLLFFRISIFYFLVDALRNSPVVLDPFRSVDRSHDRRFWVLLLCVRCCVRTFFELHF